MKKLLITFSFILMCSCFSDTMFFVKVTSLNQVVGLWAREDNKLSENESMMLINAKSNVIMLKDKVPLQIKAKQDSKGFYLSGLKDDGKEAFSCMLEINEKRDKINVIRLDDNYEFYSTIYKRMPLN